MNKHTPGPWKVKCSTTPDNVGGFDWAIYAGSHILAEAYEIVDYGKTMPVEANARLISAAPDMYEALADLLSSLEVVWSKGFAAREDLEPEIKFARAALSKAEGEA